MSDVNNGAMTGADRINHAQSIASGKRGRRGISGISGAAHERPLFGLGEAQAEIIGASGLGRRAPERRSTGEQMSDADGPTQDVQVKDGEAVHRKAVNGGVREIPVASALDHRDLTLAQYPNLDYSHTNVPAMQRRMGVPPLF